MLLIPTNQFSKVRDNNQQWLNTITYATMMLWQPESNEGNVTYRLGTTNMTDIYNIVFIAQKLWKLTAKSRKNESKTGYDYNNLLKAHYNHTFCANIIAESQKSLEFDNISKVLDKNLKLLSKERLKGWRNPYYMPDVPLNFIIAAANVYTFIISNNKDINISGTYFHNKMLEHLPEISECSLEFIQNSVKSLPLTLTDFRIMKYYNVKIVCDTDLSNLINSGLSKMLSDYVYYWIAQETPIISYIIKDYEHNRRNEQLTDQQINMILSDPLGMFKLTSYGLISSTLTRLAYHAEPRAELALKVYDIIDQYFTDIASRRTFYAHMLDLISVKCLQANQIGYVTSCFDPQPFTQHDQNTTIFQPYNSTNNNMLDTTYSIKPAGNQLATWTNVRHLAKMWNTSFIQQLFTTPYNMWNSLICSDYDTLDEKLQQLELALYNMTALSVHLQPVPTSISWGRTKYWVKLNALKPNIINNSTIFNRISTNIVDYVNINSRISLKISNYYNLYGSDLLALAKNRRKLIVQINQVLEWLNKCLTDYNDSKINKIITERIKIKSNII